MPPAEPRRGGFRRPFHYENGNGSQRVFGDYDQLKAVGNTFYGVYSGNRNGFGSSTSAIDPIFFSVTG